MVGINLLFWKKRKPTLFELHREDDPSKISGIGHVLDGIIFPDGTTVVRWRSRTPSTSVFKNYRQFEKTHVRFHGRYKIKFIGELPDGKEVGYTEDGGRSATVMANAFARAEQAKSAQSGDVLPT